MNMCKAKCEERDECEGFYFNKRKSCILLGYNPKEDYKRAKWAVMKTYCGYYNDKPLCTEKPWGSFQFKNKRKICNFLTKFEGEELAEICDETSASENCPQACAEICTCSDIRSTTFKMKNGETKSCLWLSFLKKIKNRTRACKKNPSAYDACPGVCEGWCTTKTLN